MTSEETFLVIDSRIEGYIASQKFEGLVIRQLREVRSHA
jgi:hypothetical protein